MSGYVQICLSCDSLSAILLHAITHCTQVTRFGSNIYHFYFMFHLSLPLKALSALGAAQGSQCDGSDCNIVQSGRVAWHQVTALLCVCFPRFPFLPF